jgi:predicted TIM-barrel fold metal-dependent hydrolase
MRTNGLFVAILMLLCRLTCAQTTAPPSADQLLLKDFRPQSIFRIPQTTVRKPKYPAIDIHTHTSAVNKLAERVKLMDEVGIEKQIVLPDPPANSGPRFDALYAEYAKFPGRFEMWCGLDVEELKKPDFKAAVLVAELERCARIGAKGVGELSDKGEGLYLGRGGFGPHPDDPRLDAVWEKCADLKLPVNLHMADPKWAYEPMDEHNDGLPLVYRWRRDNKPNLVDHEGLMQILERLVSRHPRTIFIACHFANLEYDLDRLGQWMDRYPNLYTDSAARHHYLATIPRFTASFIEKHQDRIMFGTDVEGGPAAVYLDNYRVWETLDEHFYGWHPGKNPPLHWPLYGMGLKDEILKKFYRDTALRILKP